MAVRSARLAGPVQADTTTDVILENDAGSGLTFLIKCVTLVNVSGTTRSITLYRSVGSGAAAAFYRVSLAASTSVILEVFWCLEPDEELACSAGAASAITVTLDGAILDGTAY